MTEQPTRLKELDDLLTKEFPSSSKDDEKDAMLQRLNELLSPPPPEEPDRLKAASEAWKNAGGLDKGEAAKEAVREALYIIDNPDRREGVPASEARGDLPQAVLSYPSEGGAPLTEGQVAILSGAGGEGKSTLTRTLALGVAAASRENPEIICGGLFRARGGTVLMAAWEDENEWPAHVLRNLARQLDADETGGRPKPSKKFQNALDHVILLDLSCRPLFGPTADDDSRPALYNARPGKMEGWGDLKRAVRKYEPRLIVIDPALAAYAGDSNAVAPVREFYQAIRKLAIKAKCGVLIVGHSNKEVRDGDPKLRSGGHIGGSAAWSDAARGAMTFVRHSGHMILTVVKATRGKKDVSTPMTPISNPQGEVLGYHPAKINGRKSMWVNTSYVEKILRDKKKARDAERKAKAEQAKQTEAAPTGDHTAKLKLAEETTGMFD